LYQKDKEIDELKRKLAIALNDLQYQTHVGLNNKNYFAFVQNKIHEVVPAEYVSVLTENIQRQHERLVESNEKLRKQHRNYFK
jgi:hypothetical protein